jgi:hypothetical protein
METAASSTLPMWPTKATVTNPSPNWKIWARITGPATRHRFLHSPDQVLAPGHLHRRRRHLFRCTHAVGLLYETSRRSYDGWYVGWPPFVRAHRSMLRSKFAAELTAWPLTRMNGLTSSRARGAILCCRVGATWTKGLVPAAIVSGYSSHETPKLEPTLIRLLPGRRQLLCVARNGLRCTVRLLTSSRWGESKMGGKHRSPTKVW